MSRNYIKVLLEPFRESKVLGSLLKWLEPGASNGSGVNKGRKDEVTYFFFCFLLMMYLRLCDWYFLVLYRCLRAGAVPRSTARLCAR